ncbi:hypothetical protein JYU19_02080 [bacterium AH-315-J21]|nr:hypothetical protein [bacterium AH-315-J21]
MPKGAKKPTYSRQVHIKMTEEHHKKLRVRAAELDMTIQDFTLNALLDALNRKTKRGR